MAKKQIKKVAWITKRDVIDALKKETVLRRGDWFHWKSGDEGNPSGNPSKGCAVCAVGAVLRKKSFENFMRCNGMDLNMTTSDLVYARGVSGDPFYLAREGNYLEALSDYFEDGHGRKQCIEFVRKHFPAKFRVEMSA